MTTNTQAPNVRLTPERLAEIRNMVPASARIGDALDDLLAELDAVTRERDEAERSHAIAIEHLTDVVVNLSGEPQDDDPVDLAHQRWMELASLRAHFAAQAATEDAPTDEDVRWLREQATWYEQHAGSFYVYLDKVNTYRRIADALETHLHNAATIASAADAPGVGVGSADEAAP